MQLNIAKAEPHCYVPNPELRCDLTNTGSFRSQPLYLVVIQNPAGTPKLLARRPCIADISRKVPHPPYEQYQFFERNQPTSMPRRIATLQRYRTEHSGKVLLTPHFGPRRGR